MEAITLGEMLNIFIGLFAALSAIVYSLIKQKVDIEHMKKQITSLFDLWNSKDKK